MSGEWGWSAAGILVPAEVLPAPRPLGIDLFSGCGGFSLGFHQAGWHVIAAADNDVWAAMTYLHNLASPDVVIHFATPDDESRWNKALRSQARGHSANPAGIISGLPGEGWLAHEAEVGPGCEHFFLGDVRQLTGRAILDAVGLEENDIGCVFGGPPCQGFSKVGRRDVHDPRNSLVFEFARLVCELKPQSLIMENVPNIVNMVTVEGIPIVDALCHIFEQGGMGTYNALRRSLLGTAGMGAAIKSRPVEKGTPSPAPEPEIMPEAPQMALFS